METKPDDLTDLQAELAALRADLAAITATLASMAQTSTEKAAVQQIEQTLEQVTDYTRKHPLQSLGIAAGLGMLLGLLFGRR
jgi:ElaB/YqjD/DUF883 family membrane-anchored ribosome-binding protein